MRDALDRIGVDDGRITTERYDIYQGRRRRDGDGRPDTRGTVRPRIRTGDGDDDGAGRLRGRAADERDRVIRTVSVE